jgi:integrase
MPSLTKRIIDAAKPGSFESFIWCSNTPGFGVRVYPSGRRVFVCQVRVGRATRRVKIGVYGPYTVDQARQRAQEIIRAASEGRDPQREKVDLRNAITVAEMCDQYLEAARANLVMTRFGRPKGAATLKIDEGRIERHIKPLLGHLRARDVTPADVQRMADAASQGRTGGVFKGKPRGKAVVTGGPVAATRAVGLLGGIFGWSEKRNLVPGPNPAHGIETARGLAKDRTLSACELAALGKAISAKATTSPNASAALRLIALTGMRREEACGLRWSEIDLAGSCLRLERTKTGRSVRPLGRAAREVLQSLPRCSEQWVFPNSTAPGAPTSRSRSQPYLKKRVFMTPDPMICDGPSPPSPLTRDTAIPLSATCWATRGEASRHDITFDAPMPLWLRQRTESPRAFSPLSMALLLQPFSN